jgi:hypothetical protein
MQVQGQLWARVQLGRKHPHPRRGSIRPRRSCVAKRKEKQHQTKMFGAKAKGSPLPRSKADGALVRMIRWPKSIMPSNARGPSTVRAKNLNVWIVRERPRNYSDSDKRGASAIPPDPIVRCLGPSARASARSSVRGLPHRSKPSAHRPKLKLIQSGAGVVSAAGILWL